MESAMISHRLALVRRAAGDPAYVASFAKLALDLALEDRDAYEIVSEELSELRTLLTPVVRSQVLSGSQPYNVWLSGSVAKHPVTQSVLRTLFRSSEIELSEVDEDAPCRKALEIAKSL